MEFNEFTRWAAEDQESDQKLQDACMKMFEETGDWDWISQAAKIERRSALRRREHAAVTGWYVV